MPDELSTGVSTGLAPVSPAQTPPALVHSLAPLNLDPMNIATQMAKQSADYEQRIAALMSQKDKALNDYQRTFNEAVTARNELEQMRQQQATTFEGAAQAARDAQARAQQLEVQLHQETAERLKLTVLATKYRDLLPYAQFIPAQGDEATLEQAILAFKAARDADLAATVQQQAPTAPTPAAPTGFQPAYPNAAYVPSANAARPPSTSAQSSAKEIDQMLKLAMSQARERNDYSIWQEALQKSQQMADQQGMKPR